jgi:competence protein ComEC
MDEIQRKLALLDSQLAGRTLCHRLVSRSPLFFPALGFMAGVLVQSGLARDSAARSSPASIPVWLIVFACGVAGAGVYLARAWRNPHPPVLAGGALLCFLCLGAIRLLAFEQTGPGDISTMVGRERLLATIRGRILTQPYQERQDWCFAPFAAGDPSSAFYLKVDGIETPTGWQPVTGTIRVQVDEPTPNLRLGHYIRAYCWLHRFEEPGNPGQFNFARYLRRRNIFVGASVPAREAIELCGAGPADIGTRLRSTFTAAAARGLLDYPPSDTQSEALLEALLLGERHNVSRDVNEAFRKTGLLHLISLSGMHLSLLIGTVWWCCKPAGFSKRTRAAICLLATAVFLLIVPPLGPILRAAVIVWAYCGSIFLRRRANALNSLSLAVIVLLLLRPTQLFEAGWQLSFTSVAGILAFTRKIEDFAHTALRDRLRPTEGATRWAARPAQRAGAGVILALSVGFAAWFGSAGILLYHFYNVTPLASVWTALASPFVTALLLLGFLKVILSFFLPTLSILLGHVLAALANLLIGLVQLMARLDFSYLLIGHVPVVLILLYYVLILSAAFVYLRRPVLKKGLCAALALTLVVSLGLLKWQRTHRDGLRLTCLDVGHGQAILAQLPGTRNILFDAGSLYGSDVGARIVVPFLDYIGIGRLHAVVISHHDLDHINGLPEVADRRRVDAAFTHRRSLPPTESTEITKRLAQHLETRRIRVEHLEQAIPARSARILVLWPAGETTRVEQFDDNNRSLVSLIEFAGRKVLLCSDIEKPAQQEILSLCPALQADVMIVPHHGSVRTLDRTFLTCLAPRILVCSCGRRDCEQGRVLKQMDSARVFLTATAGAVTICIDKPGMVRVSAFRPLQGD